MLNKVPEVTVYFWIIKIVCTTVVLAIATIVQLPRPWACFFQTPVPALSTRRSKWF